MVSFAMIGVANALVDFGVFAFAYKLLGTASRAIQHRCYLPAALVTALALIVLYIIVLAKRALQRRASLLEYILLGGFTLLLVTTAILRHPGFSAMRTISDNDGYLVLGFPFPWLPIASLVLLVLASAIAALHVFPHPTSLPPDPYSCPLSAVRWLRPRCYSGLRSPYSAWDLRTR